MKVFISYKWEDAEHNAWVERLAKDLRAAGIEALLDTWEIRYGESFSDYMIRGINSADTVLFIMTPRSIAAAEGATHHGGAIKFEVQLATARRLAEGNFRLIGVLRRGERSVKHLRDFRYADFRDDSEYDVRFRQLVADLLDQSERPPVALNLVSGLTFREEASLGEDLGTANLCSEFLLSNDDLVVWNRTASGPEAPLGLYSAGSGSYTHRPIECIPFATRVHPGPDGKLLAIQERHGVYVVDSHRMRTSNFLSIETVGEPIIRSETQHHVRPYLALGTDYGTVLLWDWHRNKVLFKRRYFPREDIVWITGLSFDASGESVMFCAENFLFVLSTSDGEVLAQHKLDPPVETGRVALNYQTGLLAVGGVMSTKVYSSPREPSLLYEVRNAGPLVQDVKFSHDGQLLGIVDGSFGMSVVTVADSASGGVFRRFAETWPARDAEPSIFAGERSISFSYRSDLLAVGEGGRVGIYKVLFPKE